MSATPSAALLLTVCLLGLGCTGPKSGQLGPVQTPQADIRPDAVQQDATPDSSQPLTITRVDNTSCVVTGKPTPPPPLTLHRVLSGASIGTPVHITSPPGGNPRLFVVSQPGRVYVAETVTDNGGAAQWLDIRSRVDDGPNEGGLLSIDFHPDFATNGQLFANYTRTQGGKFQTVISRFTVPAPPQGSPDPGSEQIILTLDQPYGNHNGGKIAFGPDGYLYIGMGDGGSGGDPQGHGQNKNDMLGAMLRIDVDNPAPGGTYSVPSSNPLVGQPLIRPELWAWGLRNPWGMDFDPVDGTLWVADVGQNAIEEVDILRAGGNYGWKIMEASACYSPANGCDQTGLILPVAEYDHSEGKSITGGVVYRGGAMATLTGAFLFGDYVSGLIWGVAPDGEGWKRTLLVDPSTLGIELHPSTFGRDAAGEPLVADHYTGAIYRLAAADPSAAGAPGWPAALSDTGCFSDLPARRLAEGIIHYEVASPLWSDAAAKERGLVLPPGATVEYRDAGAWDLPDGTIAIKTFLKGSDALETRFLVRDGDTWRGATYRWREDGTDADLLTTAATRTLSDGAQWYFPSRADCRSCHTNASGQVLGIDSRQLDRQGDILGTGASHNQLAALAAGGWLTGLPTAGATVSFEPIDQASASIDSRARAYLHANCAHCHRPGGLATATIDLRFETALADTAMCDVIPVQGDLGVADARILAPGAPERSTLLLRMTTLDGAMRMPTVASAVVDQQAADLIESWISQLGSCP